MSRQAPRKRGLSFAAPGAILGHATVLLRARTLGPDAPTEEPSMTMSGTQDAPVRELGVWYDARLARDPAACTDRHERASEEALRACAAMPTIQVGAAAIHAFLPQGVPCVALCTATGGLVRSVATASLLRVEDEACLVTALHAVCERGGGYKAHYVDHGLMALAMSGARLPLHGRAWDCYDALDVAVMSLSDDEAAHLGGALDIAYAPVPAQLWVAYGFPQSANRQSHRGRPLALQAQRLVLYDRVPLPPAAGIAAEAALCLHYDAGHAFDPGSGAPRAVRAPQGCSGGLVAAYRPELGCWLPEAIVVEWHAPQRALVAVALAALFPPR